MSADLILERRFEPPLSPVDVLERASDSGWCFKMHRVQWEASYLASTGRTMICWFTAPDAEAARLALRRAGAEIARLWRGTVHDAPVAASPNVVVERSFTAPVVLDDIQAIESAAAWCLESHRVRFARTFFSADRKRMLCLYEAPDAESVRLAQREAAMPVDAVWAFRTLGPEMLPADAARS